MRKLISGGALKNAAGMLLLSGLIGCASTSEPTPIKLAGIQRNGGLEVLDGTYHITQFVIQTPDGPKVYGVGIDNAEDQTPLDFQFRPLKGVSPYSLGTATWDELRKQLGDLRFKGEDYHVGFRNWYAVSIKKDSRIGGYFLTVDRMARVIRWRNTVYFDKSAHFSNYTGSGSDGGPGAGNGGG